jgi:hypothetical protein
MGFLKHTLGQAYLLCIDEEGTKKRSKDIITNSALEYASKRNIPISRRFSTRRRDTRSPRFRRWREARFSALQDSSFRPCTADDKLFVFGHADPESIGSISSDNVDGPRALANFLKQHGCTRIGLVTFKACEIGQGDFLDRFVVAAASAGVMIGWAKGYRGSASTSSFDKRVSETIDLLIPKGTLLSGRGPRSSDPDDWMDMQFIINQDARLWITPVPNSDYCEVQESTGARTRWRFQLDRELGEALSVKIVCGPTNSHKTDIGRFKLSNQSLSGSGSVSVVEAGALE